MNETQKARLRQLVRTRLMDLPSGVSYRQEYVPEGDYGDVRVRTIYNRGHECAFADGSEALVRLRWEAHEGEYYTTHRLRDLL